MAHDRLSSDIHAGSVAVTMSLEVQDRTQAQRLTESLRQKQIHFEILT